MWQFLPSTPSNGLGALAIPFKGRGRAGRACGVDRAGCEGLGKNRTLSNMEHFRIGSCGAM